MLFKNSIIIWICLELFLISITISYEIDNTINQSFSESQLKHSRQRFEEFLMKFNKNYDLNEKERRFKIFERNLMKIKLLNANELGSAVYGVTQFADLTTSEFRQYYTGFRPQLKKSDSIHMRKVSEKQIPINDLPQQFDWRNTSGVVSGVKNQGMCGSCWAFSATGNIEGIWAIAKKQPVSLSEQELVDCDKIDQGCNGGLPTNAYKTVIELGGIETESDYPYDGRDEKCHFNRSLSRVTIDSYVVLPQNEVSLAQWLYKYGPISIGINANAMQFYFGGISHPLKFMCNPNNLDHGVLIVGFGVAKTRFLHKLEPYWLIKNSWGKSWGEKGYYRVYRGDGTCGLNLMATSAWINSDD
jgi:cathepsin F